MERRKFTREFKLEAVRLIRDRGVSYAQAAQDLAVHQSQLRSCENDAQFEHGHVKRPRLDLNQRPPA
jgi:transposase